MNEQKNYYAHTNENGGWQLLKDHLTQTAELAENFALPEYGSCAYFAGLMHDIGKYQPSFQKRLEGSAVRVEHSISGAQEIGKLNPEWARRLFQYIIAGHHSGLPDYGAEADEDSTLLGRLHHKGEDYSAYKGEIGGELGKVGGELSSELNSFFSSCGSDINVIRDKYEFFVRYLYSCLTDADFLDTERFCSGGRPPLPKADFEKALALIKERFASFTADTPLKAARSRLQAQAYKNAENGGKIYLLNMPTGSGKTLCSMRLALERAIKTGKKRIIYVIPYTSIIEQTANEFRPFFPDTEILEHHSNFDFGENDGDEDGDDDDVKKILKKSTENWNASVIITTNVQFFESIYSNKSSRLRKLHNMADSVIVFDEIHTLPEKYLLPCLKAVGALTSDYKSEAIFLTATMPSFSRLAERFKEAFGSISTVDLLPDKSDYSFFDKCEYEYLGECDPLGKIDCGTSTLVICNTKKTARRLYDSFTAVPDERKYFLSTYIVPEDRSRLIAEIKDSLKDGKKLIVFSTSLVEAGVDFDFDCVFRELAGLDNILQAGGRCNREGKRKKEESKVYIFKSGDKPSGDVAAKANVAEGIIRKNKSSSFSSKDIEDYFDEIYRFKIEPSEKEVTPKNFYKVPFASIAKDFNFIDNISAAVVVPHEEIKGEIAKLKAAGFCNRRLLSRYSATVSKKELEELSERGLIEEVNGVFILLSPERYYDPKTGIKTDGGGEFIFYC